MDSASAGPEPEREPLATGRQIKGSTGPAWSPGALCPGGVLVLVVCECFARRLRLRFIELATPRARGRMAPAEAEPPVSSRDPYVCACVCTHRCACMACVRVRPPCVASARRPPQRLSPPPSRIVPEWREQRRRSRHVEAVYPPALRRLCAPPAPAPLTTLTYRSRVERAAPSRPPRRSRIPPRPASPLRAARPSASHHPHVSFQSGESSAVAAAT